MIKEMKYLLKNKQSIKDNLTNLSEFVFKAIEAIVTAMEAQEKEIDQLKKQLRNPLVKNLTIQTQTAMPPRVPQNYVKRLPPSRKELMKDLQQTFKKRGMKTKL